MAEKTREEELEILLAESDLRVDTLEDRVAELESQCLNLAESNDALDNHNDELLEECENLRAQLNAVVDEDLGGRVIREDVANTKEVDRLRAELSYAKKIIDQSSGEVFKAQALREILQSLLTSWNVPKHKPFTPEAMIERPSTDPDTVYGTKG